MTGKTKKNKVKTKQNTINMPIAETAQFSNGKTIKLLVFSAIAVLFGAITFFTYLVARSSDQWQRNNYQKPDVGVIENSNDMQGELPRLFPSDFPIYAYSTVKNNWTTKSANVTGISVAWETPDSAVKVFNFYFSELSSRGYKVEVVSQTDKNFTLSFEKEGLSGFMGVAQEEKTLISVTIGIKNEN